MNVNEERHRALKRQLVAAARSVVTYQVGLPHGCTRMSRIASWLRPYEPVELPSVAQYLARVGHLPIGTERLEWDRTALRRMDVELEAVNSAFRDAVFAQCFQIIDAQSQDETDP